MLVDARRARFWVFSLLLAFVAVASDRAAAGGRFDFFWPDRIVVFGTRLSDPGNGHFLSGKLTAPPAWPGVDP